MYYCIARLQRVANLIYSDLLLGTHTKAVVWISISHIQCMQLCSRLSWGLGSGEKKFRVLYCSSWNVPNASHTSVSLKDKIATNDAFDSV